MYECMFVPEWEGVTWVFFGRVCAARDSKLAPRLYPVLEFALKLIPRPINGPIFSNFLYSVLESW